MTNKMSILTVLVIGIAIVGLVSPVIASRPCYHIGVMGTITDADGDPAEGWKVKVDFRDHGYGWVNLVDTTVDSSGNYESTCSGAVPCDGSTECPTDLGQCEYRDYKRWIWNSDNELIVDGEIWRPECDDWATDGVCACVLRWDYVAQPYIPEFSTIAIPVVSILGLLFFFNYRKRRGNK